MSESATPRPILRPKDFRGEFVKVGKLSMHVVTEGPKDAPLVVLLHGFPEFWYSWRYQIKALAEAGYRVAAPDQRGYNLTDKSGPFDVFTLTADINELVRVLGYKTATICGHDWGGAVAWLTAAFYPDLTERLIVCNCPHPVILLEAVRGGNWAQLRKSWYIGFFQIPALPELLLSARSYDVPARTIRSNGRSPITDEEVGYFREAWSQPGALSAGISWYRAMLREGGQMRRRNLVVNAPARLIWGLPDPFLGKELAEKSRAYCPNLDIQYIEKAGHFVQQDRPEPVNQLMLEFLKG